MCDTVATTPRELDELPDGTVVEVQDGRETRLYKESGHWRNSKKAATQNVYTYVNARRYGVRIVKKGTQQ